MAMLLWLVLQGLSFWYSGNNVGFGHHWLGSTVFESGCSPVLMCLLLTEKQALLLRETCFCGIAVGFGLGPLTL